MIQLFRVEGEATQRKVVAIAVKASVNFENHRRLIKYGFFEELLTREGRLEMFGLLNLGLNPDNYDHISEKLKALFARVFGEWDEPVESKYLVGLAETTLRYLVEKKKRRENEKIVVMQKAVVPLLVILFRA